MKSVWRLFWLSLCVKMLLATFLPMTSDESYYWVWSYHPQLNYYDHPSMVAWLFTLAQPFEAFLSAVRWPGVILSHGTIFLWILILKEHLSFSSDQVKNWLWLMLLCPLVGGGALIITPDIPLLFFWTLSLLCFLRFIDRPGWMLAMAFGVCLGFGLISKYLIALLPISVLMASLVQREWWHHTWKYLGFIFVGFFFGAWPFFLWNVQNDWISLHFQLGHGLGAKVWRPSWTVEYILLQVILIFPPILYIAIKNIKKVPLWLNAVAWVPLLFFVLTSFRGYVEANWPIMAYPAIFAVAVWSGGQRAQVFTRWFWGTALLLAMVLVFTRYSPFEKPIKANEFYEYEGIYHLLDKELPIFARSYQMASRLSFEGKRTVYKLRGHNRVDAYDFWEGSLPPRHFYFVVELNETLPQDYINRGYEVVGEERVTERFKVLEVKKP